ncbi:retrovirus-related Pol polyprotein from transposon TNT 1-94 [Trichonephila clavipes]|nr:retrovirus-related Pol polyprotein from transposon TNT 1-94 [Trichonephila clavipes]
MNSVASTLNRVTGMEFNNQISVLTPNNWNTWKHDMQAFQLIRWLPQEFQSTVQQIYRWKEEDFRVVKIEAELILEANRLQLMKQDLEKAENAYLSGFTSRRSRRRYLVLRLQLMEIQMARMITKRKVVSKNDSVKGLPRLTDNGKTHCIPCKLAKSKRVSFKKDGGRKIKTSIGIVAYGPLWSNAN